MRLRFLGAVGTVTGSRTLVTAGPAQRPTQVLVDCGLFQGWKPLRQRNWEPPPFDPAALDAVILTHAHLDHSGALPVLIRGGFRGPVLCTPATRDLCGLLLPDSGYLQEEDARYANRKGFSRHQPARPLYTRDEAERSLSRLRAVPFDEEIAVGEHLALRFMPTGHILGAAMALLREGETTTLFSGDVGRADDLLMSPPTPSPAVDALVCESTYGDRLHDAGDPLEALKEVVNRTLGRGGQVLIPAFAVGRAQAVLLALHRLQRAHEIPSVPLYLNSPMAVDTTALYVRYTALHRMSPEEARALCAAVVLVRSEAESRALVERRGPCVIVSASGMLTGGRVLHHLRAMAPDARNTVLLVGFQAPGTRGQALAGGATRIKLHGLWLDVRCEVRHLDVFSAHADQSELTGWLRSAAAPPRQLLLNHGEPASTEALRVHLKETLGLRATAPQYGDEVEVGPPAADRAPTPVAERLFAITRSPSYLRADQDPALLNRDELRSVRLMLEYIKPDLALRAHGINATVVVFGGTRIVDEADAEARLDAARAAVTAAPDDPDAATALARAERIAAKAHYYEEARAFGRLASTQPLNGHQRVVVVTGGGPGVMEAANRGACESGALSMGFNITLPHEQHPNAYITPDLCFQFRYFALRKMHFMLRAQALVAFPGGYGTLDELFDALCLIQTGKMARMPVVLVGADFWRHAFDVGFLAAEGVIDPADVSLFEIVDTATEAWDYIRAWYRTARGEPALDGLDHTPGDPRRLA